MENERTWLKIDLDSIGSNIDNVRKKVGDTKILAVIKADAYGHGAVEVGKYLESRVDYFGIAVIEEGMQLRRAGIQKPIMILGNTIEARFPEAVEYEIMPTIFTYAMAAKLNRVAEAFCKIAKIHVAVDTGMSRIGFIPETELDEVLKISRLSNIKIEGLFTHFACADECDKSYSEKQLKRFNAFCDRLAENGIVPAVRHISNSAGIIEFGDCRFDMVRSGIMTYGLYPSKDVDPGFKLTPAMSMLTEIVHLKTLPAGCGVSYGATYVTKADTRVATLAVGYADGYPRALSNKGKVLIRGKFAPIIGRVCMDQMMVDVTDIPEAKVGDSVVLIGKQGDNSISVEDLADNASSFNYEFVCGLGMRVPRIYYKDGLPYSRVCYIEKYPVI